MLVHELITELSRLPVDAPVYRPVMEGERGAGLIDVTATRQEYADGFSVVVVS